MPDRPDLQRLADHLRVLANPNRLELLYELRRPRAVKEIELSPETVRSGENPSRPISHQAIRDHLSKLNSIQVVAIERTERDGHVVDEHVLNHQRLFAIVEELRSLGELKAPESPVEEETIPADREASERDVVGPRLVLARGQGEGRVFPLHEGSRSGERGWLIGRKDGLAVPLDYDPYVSSENSVIRRTGDGFEILDLPESRNGTFVNFDQLPPGGSSLLEQGDIVSVGKTNLVFQDA